MQLLLLLLFLHYMKWTFCWNDDDDALLCVYCIYVHSFLSIDIYRTTIDMVVLSTTGDTQVPP